MSRPTRLALLLLCLTGSSASATESAPCGRKISVVGRAEASHVPDWVALTLASESKAPNVAGALEASAKSVAEIGALARDLGVPASDILTLSLVLEEATRTVSRTLGADQREPDGFRARNRVSVRLAERSRASELVRRALDKGCIRIEAAELGLAEPQKAESALLVAAAKDARARATAIAQAAGASAGVVCSLTTSKAMASSPMPHPAGQTSDYDLYKSSDGSRGKATFQVPIESGTIDLTAEVTAVFAAQP